MSVAEIVNEARKLPLAQLQLLAAELDEAVAQRVDSRFNEAVEAGAFDQMAAEALHEYRAGKTKPLDNLVLHWQA